VIFNKNINKNKKLHILSKFSPFSPKNLLTLLGLYLSYQIVQLYPWFIGESVWSGTPETCRQANGACWAFIREKFRYILLGSYPQDEQWRPIVALLLLLFVFLYAARKNFLDYKLIVIFPISLLSYVALLRGGFMKLSAIDTDLWGGLPLTILLASFAIVFAYPLGIVLALARRSNMLVFQKAAVFYIEIIRALPHVTLLFVASTMLPILFPEGYAIDKLLRAQVVIILFYSAYLAEVFRGGLQGLPKGQYEAAASVGLTNRLSFQKIILPQALKLVIPATIGVFITVFKDTSLVVIIALFDLLLTTKSAMSDTQWQGFSVEGYIFVGIIYFIFCYSLSLYGRRLEKFLHPERKI